MMIGTDKYSYLSKLKTVNPAAKLAMSAASVILCLGTDSVLVSLLAVVVFCVLSARKGGTPARIFLGLLRTPLAFLLIGTITIMLGRFETMEQTLVGVRLGAWVYGISPASLALGGTIIMRAMGCVSSVYFTVLATPVTDLLPALRRMHVPQLFISLMELIYRFIFVLYDAAKRIQIAQASRLGYSGLRRSYRSLGELLGAVFLKAYRKADNVFVALESRGYEGDLCVLAQEYESGRAVYIWCACLTAAQIAVFFLERWLLQCI